VHCNGHRTILKRLRGYSIHWKVDQFLERTLKPKRTMWSRTGGRVGLWWRMRRSSRDNKLMNLWRGEGTKGS
jgi:hypothetical protein